MVGMRQQGAWTQWELAMDRKISWTELWKAEPYRIQFLIWSRGSLEHILSCCPKALGEGRYRWRHNQVLRVIAETISTGISLSKHQQPAQRTIAFVKAGEKPSGSRNPAGGLLATA
ncbi:Sterol 3-beta-glucosyltransferase [Labeo rohita]|uniref:Sterol 3-beta-glucosyltransferase n=1 Tax=Labeo rohita TaxID=84645 RepID=A0ABQ8MDB3_LABRO|nr:Sterol 3-beta-glucosyltransferase [Labeo rohita]